MQKIKSIILVLFFSLSIFAQHKDAIDLEKFLNDCKGGNWNYETNQITVKVMQPLDNNEPDGPKYPQYVHIKHSDFSKPVVLHDRGYYARPQRIHELTRILDCNQIEIEHRFFAPSAPEEPIDWTKLSIKSAADDQHAIVVAMKKLYKGKFVNVGGSKGGQAALFHEYFYPEDNDATVAYVAPINTDMEDRRITEYIKDSISTTSDRERMLNYQRELLKRREEIIPLFIKEVEDKNQTMIASVDSCFEHSVFEFAFGWWQYQKPDITKIPLPGATAEELYKPFEGTVDFFTVEGRDRVKPFNYQAYTQIGFYDYDTRPFKDLLIAVKNDFESNKPFFYDRTWSDPYDPEPLRKVSDWLTNEAENVIYIYGEFDPWSATGIWPSGKTNSFRMTEKGGNHGARITRFYGEDRERILTALEEWLDVKIDRSKVDPPQRN